ncbi:MAG: ATP-binding cassette domain-containing protein [Bacteroidales bacterium]|nr:ATP-binding cassette domain-containing protein [Bacteroidales bacterium]MCF8404023.1 ATP-binding cassette domain-containing protein [Bacteroidales bacterium]
MARHGKPSSERDTPKKKVTRQGLKRFFRLFRFVKPQRKVFALGLFFLILSSLTTLVFPMLIGDLLDSANSGTLEKINKIGLILLGIFVANAFFSYFRIYLFAVVTQKTLALLRQTTYNHLIKLPMVFFSSRRVGELNSRISADIALLQETFTSTLAQFIRQVITIFGGIALLSIISPRLTLFMLAFIPVVAIIARIFGTFIRKLSKQTQDKVAESNTIVEETLQAIANVKAFSNEAFEIFRYKKKTDEVIDIALKGAKYRGLFVSFIFFALFGSIVGVIWYGVYLVNKGEGMTSGDLFKFVLYTVFIAGSISGMADLYSQLQKAIGATENLLDILDENPEPIDLTREHKDICCNGEVRFRHVNFNYPTRKDMVVLNDITFSVQKGEQVALVGPSGAGKSTITQLLFRFYDPVSGEITIDSKNIKDYDLGELRNNMAIVPQEVLLFGGTIRENIEYGKPGASEDEIIQAAKKANAWEFIDSFPENLETRVGERGIQLSGGQRQRIAIARAILKDPAILILDEATSSLDSESERLVQEALLKLMEGRTSIIIAHRLSTIHNADKIIVIDKGEVKESGTHEELLKLENGIYRNLSMLQIDLMG